MCACVRVCVCACVRVYLTVFVYACVRVCGYLSACMDSVPLRCKLFVSPHATPDDISLHMDPTFIYV